MTEIKGGKKIEKHLCEQCAAAQGDLPVQAHTPINELLTNFVMAHSGLTREQSTACEQCGMTWSQFRQTGLLGCEHDYTLFEKDLTPLLQRAHESGTHHIGKVPVRRGSGGESGSGGAGIPAARKRIDLNKLRKELQRAVETEDYERAAKLRDQIREAEASS
jgi:protein arginine kinase activator